MRHVELLVSAALQESFLSVEIIHVMRANDSNDRFTALIAVGVGHTPLALSGRGGGRSRSTVVGVGLVRHNQYIWLSNRVCVQLLSLLCCVVSDVLEFVQSLAKEEEGTEGEGS